MALLLDIFGFLTVILRGLSISAQAFTVGGITFILFLARPLRGALEETGDRILARSLRITAWAALGLAAVETLTALAETKILIETADLSLAEALGAAFVTAGALKIAAALTIAALCRWAPARGALA